MIFRILRSISQPLNKYPITVQSYLEVLKSTTASQEAVPSIIKLYFHLYTDTKTSNVSVNWSSDLTITNSITSIIPFLTKTEHRFINSLIVSLGFMGISNHPIWKHLEPIFVKSSHTVVENAYIPFMISSFSLCKCENPSLWSILNKKMLDDYCKNHPLTITTASLTYKSLLKANQGSPALLKILKEGIIKDIDQIKPALITDLLSALSYAKIFDRDLLPRIAKQVIEQLDDIEINELSQILANFNLLKIERNLIEKVENKIIDKSEDLNLRGIMNCFSIYSQKQSESKEFPKRLFFYYVENRDRLKVGIRDLQTLAAYDIKMLGTSIGMQFEVPDEFFLRVYKEIKDSKVNTENNKSLMGNNATIEKYRMFHKFQV